MNLPTESFRWSKNLLDPNAPAWALLSSTMSFGIIDSSGFAGYNIITDKVSFKTYKLKEAADASLKKGRALVETIYREFKTF